MEEQKLSFEDKIIELQERGTDIYTMEDCIDDMLYDLDKGKEKGSTTFIEGLDNAWTWRMGEFNIWTGYTNEGKSQWLRYLSLVKALGQHSRNDDWNFSFYAPEDYPAKEFFDDIIHTASGQSTDKENMNFIGKINYKHIYSQLKNYFFFNYIRPPKNSITEVLKSFIPLIEEKNVKVCVIDPLIKVARPAKYINADDKYAMYITTICTDFARQYNISLHLVMHQLTPRIQENNLYPRPSVYNIKGGGTWADGTDNILILQRPMYASDKKDDEVLFASQKIKKQKLVGIPQDFKIRFNRKTNRYIDFNTGKDLFDFNKMLRSSQIKLTF